MDSDNLTIRQTVIIWSVFLLVLWCFACVVEWTA